MEYSSGDLTSNSDPTSDVAHGTQASAILVPSSGDHQGEVT